MLNQRVCRTGWLALALVWAAAVLPADVPTPATAEAEAIEPQDADPAADTDNAGPAVEAEGATDGEPARGSRGNPYEAIIIRNSFGLRDPPPPPPPPQEPPPTVNPTALKLTGITTLLGKRAMFVFMMARPTRSPIWCGKGSATGSSRTSRCSRSMPLPGTFACCLAARK